jgi:protoporphyrinogen oxidase
MDSSTIIIGVGLAGLSCAYHLRSGYRIYEKTSQIGGNCRSRRIGDFSFDLGGHFIHLRDPYAEKLVHSLMGENLIEVERRSGIYFGDNMVPYPFQMNLYSLPHEAKLECLKGAIEAHYGSKRKIFDDFGEWIDGTLGKGIMRHFMEPYNTKLWGLSPYEMSMDWVHGFVPEPNVWEIVEGALRRQEGVGYNASFLYPRRGGIQSLCDSFLPYMNNLEIDSAVEQIDPEDSTIKVSGKKQSYKNIVSTVPLPRLIGMLSDPPKKVIRAAEKLRCNTVKVVMLGVKNVRLPEYHWIYFPQNEISFYRLVNFSAVTDAMSPEGYSSVCVEIASLGKGFKPDEELIQQSISDLIDIGYILSKDDVVVSNVEDMDYAYVTYDKARRNNVELVQEYLKRVGIDSTGRYGAWEYSTMETAILQGKQVAEKISVKNSARRGRE